MRKGLITALMAGALSLGATSFAAAPTIFNLPDVTVGDLDAPDCVGTGANFFVFTSAFNLDDKVSDPDTPKASLLWSFAEYDDILDLDSNPASQSYQVNGKNPILVGDAAIIADDLAGNPAPKSPGADEIRGVSPDVSFRDIVLSPLSGPPFNPSPNQLAEHAAGKVMRFYAYDGSNVATQEILIRSVDNVCDLVSGASQLGCVSSDPLVTSANWVTEWLEPAASDPSFGSLVSRDFDATNQAIRVRIGADPGTANSATVQGIFRIGGWKTTDAYNLATLPYASIGTDNFVRSKWFVYATNPTGGVPANHNTIPTTRMQLGIRSVVLTTLEIFTHTNDGTANGITADLLGKDIRPSADPANASMYRSDFDPVDVPYLITNGATEAMYRGFIGQGDKPQDNGFVALTESVVGCIPKSAATWTTLQTLTTSATDAGALRITSPSVVGGPSFLRFSYPFSSLSGRIPIVDFASGPTLSETAAGVTLDSTAYDNQPQAGLFVGGSRAGILYVNFWPGANLAARPRVEPNTQYRVRFHVVSNTDSNKQPQLRMQASAGNSTYVQKYEVGGAMAGGDQAKTISRQALPGVGTQNPDKIGTENGGFYNLMMVSPLSLNVRPDTAGTLAQRMPSWFAFAGQGVNDTGQTYGGGANPTTAELNRRDLRLLAMILDTLTFTGDTQPLTEAGRFTIDSIQVSSSPLIDDGTPE